MQHVRQYAMPLTWECPLAHAHNFPPVCQPLRPLDTFTSSLVPTIGYGLVDYRRATVRSLRSSANSDCITLFSMDCSFSSTSCTSTSPCMTRCSAMQRSAVHGGGACMMQCVSNPNSSCALIADSLQQSSFAIKLWGRLLFHQVTGCHKQTI